MILFVFMSHGSGGVLSWTVKVGVYGLDAYNRPAAGPKWDIKIGKSNTKWEGSRCVTPARRTAAVGDTRILFTASLPTEPLRVKRLPQG